MTETALSACQRGAKTTRGGVNWVSELAWNTNQLEAVDELHAGLRTVAGFIDKMSMLADLLATSKRAYAVLSTAVLYYFRSMQYCIIRYYFRLRASRSLHGVACTLRNSGFVLLSNSYGAEFRRAVMTIANVEFRKRPGGRWWVCKQAYGKDIENFLKGVDLQLKEPWSPCAVNVFPVGAYREGLAAHCALFAGLFYLHRVGNPVEAFSKSREEIRAFEEKVGDKWVAVSDRFWGAVTQVRTPVRVFYSHVT